jgi:hypothetical protein
MKVKDTAQATVTGLQGVSIGCIADINHRHKFAGHPPQFDVSGPMSFSLTQLAFEQHSEEQPGFLPARE